MSHTDGMQQVVAAGRAGEEGAEEKCLLVIFFPPSSVNPSHNMADTTEREKHSPDKTATLSAFVGVTQQRAQFSETSPRV